MAFVTRGSGSGFFLTVTLIDTQGDTSTKRYALSSADMTLALADTAIVLAALNGVTDSAVQSYSISLVYDDDAFALPSGADNSLKAVMTYQLANKAQKAVEAIPAPKNSLFVDEFGEGNNVIDKSDPAVIAYVQMYQSGNQCFLSDGDLSDFLVRGKRSTRR